MRGSNGYQQEREKGHRRRAPSPPFMWTYVSVHPLNYIAHKYIYMNDSYMYVKFIYIYIYRALFQNALIIIPVNELSMPMRSSQSMSW